MTPQNNLCYKLFVDQIQNEERVRSMQIVFTSELNRLAHRIKKLLGLTWGESLRIAIKVIPFWGGPLSSKTSVFMKWDQRNVSGVAGHFWGLYKTYKEMGDEGRAFAFKKAATFLYVSRDNLLQVSLKDISAQKKIGVSIVNEIIDYWISAHRDGYTPRSKELMSTSPTYARLVEKSYWIY